ncbi:DUF739 family protein [Lactococcus lactis]
MSREDWRTGSIPELPLLRMQKFKTQKGCIMTIDYSKLKGRIKEKYGSQQDFAKAIGLSEKIISDKLNNKSYWKQSDIDAATELLGIKKEDIGIYFFNKKVQKI